MPSILILGLVEEEPKTSVQVYTRDLARGFTELGGWDVRAANIDAAAQQEPCDVALIHGGGAWYRRNREAILGLSRLTASFMEVAFNVDVPFTMLRGRRGTELLFPMPYALEEAPPACGETALLLDHPHPWQAKPVDEAWRLELYAALEALRGEVRVAQMQRIADRGDAPELPWAEVVPQLPYEQYLEATGEFTHFVMTHQGSYNATVLDMAARGGVCMAPTRIGRPDHFDILGLFCTDTGARVVKAVREIVAPLPRPCGLTTMTKAVEVMDAVLRRRLG